MNRSAIYASIAKDIAARLKSLHLITDDDLNDIIDNADNGNLTGIFSSVTNKDIFSRVADVISNWDGIEDSISLIGNFYTFGVEHINQHNFKDIGVYDDNAHFVCASFDFLQKLRTGTDASHIRLLERIWPSIDGNSGHKEDFWNMVRTGGANRYMLITNSSPANTSDGWRLYSFGFLLYCNTNRFVKPHQLDFDPKTPFKQNVALINTAKYNQFFDVYDMMNEAHFCDDILSRYLNMYHILEHLCYRRHLAKISRGDTKRNAFVRKALTQFGKGSKSESEEIPDGIVFLFPNLASMFTATDITPDNKTFLREEYNIHIGTTPTNSQIAKAIYQLRNSIAHNKATELHFAYANVDEYRNIIDLVKKIIEKLEPAIIDLIGNNPLTSGDHPLEYRKRTFETY